MRIEYSPSSRHGECAKCGKKFIRRAIDVNDDGKLCRNCYLKAQEFRFGDWVVYDPGYKQEIGRVTQCGERSAFVCYTQGCTAASTPLEFLRPANEAEIAAASAGIGYHRFDEFCPSRDEECCQGCRAKGGDR